MTSRNCWLRLQTVCALALFSVVGIVWTGRVWQARAADGAAMALEPAFKQHVKPFLEQNCLRCHNADTMMSGVRFSQLVRHREESGDWARLNEIT